MYSTSTSKPHSLFNSDRIFFKSQRLKPEEMHEIDEKTEWDVNKTNGYLLGAAWFNPVTVVPHPLLMQKLPKGKQFNFEFSLKFFGMTHDSMHSVTAVDQHEKTGQVREYRSFLRSFWCYFVDLFLLLNIARLFAALLYKDTKMKYMLGDMSFHWTPRSHYLALPILVMHTSAFFTNLVFQFKMKDMKTLKWMVPFSLFSGDVSPLTVRLRSAHQFRRMIVTVKGTFWYTKIIFLTWIAFSFLLLIGSPLRYTDGYTEEEKQIALAWGIINSLAAFFTLGILTWSLAYFHCLSYYLRLRYKRLNKIIFALLDDNGLIPMSKRADFLAEVIYEHDKISHDVGYWNRFWKWVILVFYCTYIPLEFWLLYTICFYSTTWTLKFGFWMAFTQFFFSLVLIITSGEMVSNQAHLGYKWLNALCLKKFPVSLMIKQAEMIERLGGPTIGFSCYDFFVVARETFYDMMILLGTQFFLMVDFALSYM